MIDRILSGDESGVDLKAESKVVEIIVKRLDQSIVGQPKAKEALAQAISENIHSILPKEGPMGVFLFTGPTGVGKTESVKAITHLLMGDKKYLVKINGEQFQESHTISRLFGSPPSYVGYNDPPILAQIEDNYTDAKENGTLSLILRRCNSFGVLLIDECEKMNSRVMQSLLGALDDGKVKLSNGKEINLQETLVIMTSNIGESEKRDAREGIGFTKPSGGEEHTMKRAMKFLSPEMLGRIDGIIEFEPLTKDDAKKIIDQITGRINSVLVGWSDQNTEITLELHESAKELIINKGFSEDKGARELMRSYRRLIDTPFAKIIAHHGALFTFPESSVVIEGSEKDGRIAFSIPKDRITERIREVKSKTLYLPNKRKDDRN